MNQKCPSNLCAAVWWLHMWKDFEAMKAGKSAIWHWLIYPYKENMLLDLSSSMILTNKTCKNIFVILVYVCGLTSGLNSDFIQKDFDPIVRCYLLLSFRKPISLPKPPVMEKNKSSFLLTVITVCERGASIQVTPFFQLYI